MKVTKSITNVGVNDHNVDLFEGQFDVRTNGMAYNSYVILDSKIAVIDTVDIHFASEWLKNVADACNGHNPDYLVIEHLEPDHAGSIVEFLKVYPNTTVVSNKTAFGYMQSYFGDDVAPNRMVVENGGTLSLGNHELTFVFAPFVHWPEVMVAYDSFEKVLFSADGFGKFGALDYDDPEGWACEARRYYFGIVGPYGAQVQKLLAAASTLDIQIICPLHGPVLTENLGYYLGLYNTWSSYEPEEDGILIAYASVYGNTKQAALELEQALKEKTSGLGNSAPVIKVIDLAREDLHECVEDAFRYSKLVCATITYNGGVFPIMRNFIENLTERKYQKRTVAFIEGGTWAPTAAKGMAKLFEESPELEILDKKVTVRGAVDSDTRAQISELADALL